jgi:hypothetical protein
LSRNQLPSTTTEVVTKIEEATGTSVMHYTKDMNQLVLKISIVSPRLMTQCKVDHLRCIAYIFVLGRKHIYDIFNEPCTFFEANIDFEICFMADYRMVGCCWVEAPAFTYHGIQGEPESNCQIEVK